MGNLCSQLFGSSDGTRDRSTGQGTVRRNESHTFRARTEDYFHERRRRLATCFFTLVLVVLLCGPLPVGTKHTTQANASTTQAPRSVDVDDSLVTAIVYVVVAVVWFCYWNVVAVADITERCGNALNRRNPGGAFGFECVMHIACCCSGVVSCLRVISIVLLQCLGVVAWLLNTEIIRASGAAHVTGLIWALYTAFFLVAAIVFLSFVTDRTGPLRSLVSGSTLEAKHAAVDQVARRWSVLYLLGWTFVASASLLTLVGVPVEICGRARLLASSLLAPQFLLVPAHELGPYEFARAVSRAQVVAMCCGFAGVARACWLISSGRTAHLDSHVAWTIFGGSSLGIIAVESTRVLIFCVKRRCVSPLRSQLGQSELQREQSLLTHSKPFPCTLCGVAVADAMNLPCGHSFFCMRCAKKFQEHEGTVCNACRQPSRLMTQGSRERVQVTIDASSANPLVLLIGVWRSRQARRSEREMEKRRRCGSCGKGPEDVAFGVNAPCGHSTLCMACADTWRTEHGNVCSVCKKSSRLECAVRVQTCELCFSAASGHDVIATGPCGHQFCVNCLIGFVRSALGSVADDVKPGGLRCPGFYQGCTGFLTTATVRQHLLDRRGVAEPDGEPLSEEEVGRLERFVMESDIPIEERFWCVNEACARLSRVDLPLLLQQDKVQMSCPHCHESQCIRCKVRWHGALTCKEVQDMDVNPNEQSTIALEEATTKPCPRCSFRISHYHGHACHHIAPGTGCLNCGTHFCYSCLREGRSCSRCRLFCSSDGIEANLVAKPFPYDRRCGCPICPDCRPGAHCPQCDGSCVVCRGLVPPGTMQAETGSGASGLSPARSVGAVAGRWQWSGLW